MTSITRSGIATAALILWVWAGGSANVGAQTNDETSSFTCVAGDDAAWRCSQDGSAPQAAALPELKPTKPPAAPPSGPNIFPIRNPAGDPDNNVSNGPVNGPANSAASGVSAIDQLMPNSRPAPVSATQLDNFTIKIASVSSESEIPSFIESYGLDPALVRFMPITEGNNTRQLIMWGRFASPNQAARAVVAMPAVVQAMKPQIAQVGTLSSKPLDYVSLDRKTGPSPGRPAPPTAPDQEQVMATAASAGPDDPTDITTASTQQASIPDLDPEPETEPEPELVARSEPPRKPAPQTEAAPESAAAVTDSALVRPFTPAPTQSVAVATPDLAGQSAPPEDQARDQARNQARDQARDQALLAATDRPVETRMERDVEVPAKVPDLARASLPAPEPSAAIAPIENRPPPKKARVTALPQQPIAVPDIAGRSAMLALEPKGFVIQLTSLSKRGLLPLYLNRHGLSAAGLLAIEIDEGAGNRMLLLKGGYNSLAAAEAALAELPSSIRSPWIRTVAPLQQALTDG